MTASPFWGFNLQPQIISFTISFCSSEEKEVLSEIESFPDKEITVMEIDKNAYRETLDFTKDTDNNWKKLIRDNE